MADNLTTPVSVSFASYKGATNYEVRDYFGTIVSSGVVSGTTVVITPPANGWKFGWYRIYFTGPNVDSLFGNSYGARNFIVVRDTSGYPANVSSSFYNGLRHGSEGRDVYVHVTLGIPGPRLQIGDAANPSQAGSFIDNLQACEDSLTDVRTP